MLADSSPQPGWELDREHRRRLRHIHAPSQRRALCITAGLPLRAAEPARQQPGSLSHRDTSLCQVSSSVDPLGILTSTSPVTSHAINILPCMSQPGRNAPRQLQPPVAQRDVKAKVAHCVGGVVSPVLANLFMHYVFDKWLEREFPAVEFERYADDAVVHCTTQRQAREVLAALEQRMAEAGLQLHPDKTRIVYCKDRKRCQRYDGPASFTFLGYTFRARKAPTRDGTSMFAAFLPAVSKDALNRMSEELRSWRIHTRTTTELGDIASGSTPSSEGMDGLLRQVLPDRAERPAAAHQRLPGALGTTEVQAAADIQESPQVVGGTARKAARDVRHWAWMAEFRNSLQMRRAE